MIISNVLIYGTSIFIYCMAVWRISSLLVNEKGPFFVFERLRDRSGILHDQDGRPYAYPDNFSAQVLSCIWCTSMYVGLLMLGFILVNQYIAFCFAVCLSFSTGAIIIDSLIKYLQGER